MIIIENDEIRFNIEQMLCKVRRSRIFYYTYIVKVRCTTLQFFKQQKVTLIKWYLFEEPLATPISTQSDRGAIE